MTNASALSEKKPPLIDEQTKINKQAWKKVPPCLLNYYLSKLINEQNSRPIKLHKYHVWPFNLPLFAGFVISYFDGREESTSYEQCIGSAWKFKNGFISTFVPAPYYCTIVLCGPQGPFGCNQLQTRSIRINSFPVSMKA